MLDLNRLPNELLQEVLSYLPPRTLLRHCRPVCRRWRDVVDGWGLWRSILPWKHPDLWPVIRTCLPPADAPGPCILGRFCERRPIGRNLLRNSQNPRGLGGSPGKGSSWEWERGCGSLIFGGAWQGSIGETHGTLTELTSGRRTFYTSLFYLTRGFQKHSLVMLCMMEGTYRGISEVFPHFCHSPGNK